MGGGYKERRRCNTGNHNFIIYLWNAFVNDRKSRCNMQTKKTYIEQVSKVTKMLVVLSSTANNATLCNMQ